MQTYTYRDTYTLTSTNTLQAPFPGDLVSTTAHTLTDLCLPEKLPAAPKSPKAQMLDKDNLSQLN